MDDLDLRHDRVLIKSREIIENDAKEQIGKPKM